MVAINHTAIKLQKPYYQLLINVHYTINMNVMHLVGSMPWNIYNLFKTE